MSNEEKILFFREMVKIFNEVAENIYPFWADYNEGMVHWSEDIANYLGFPSKDMEVNDAECFYNSLIHPSDRIRYIEGADAMFRGETEGFNCNYYIKNKSGNYVSFTTRSKLLRDHNGVPQIFLGVVLNHDATTRMDDLTGSNNKSALISKIRLFITKEKNFGLMFFGLRNFEIINSTYGYDNGSDVLMQVSVKLKEIMGANNCYRCSGSKFAVFFEEDIASKEEEIKEKYNIIRDFLEKDIYINSDRVSIGIYGGMINSRDFIASSAYLNNVLYQALSMGKASGNSNFVYYNGDILISNKRKQEMLYDIIRCVNDNHRGFYLVYQPIVEANENKIVGVEALLRWQDSQRGSITPDYFIDQIEKEVNFYGLSNWIIEKALMDCKEFIDRDPDFFISVNLSYAQLHNDRFIYDLDEIVKRVNISYKNLNIELTKRCEIQDGTNVKGRILELFNKGVKIAIDDFGSSYTSLNLLTNYPAERIKISREFIADIQSNDIKQIMLHAIVDCIEKLNKKICIEGVEDKELLDFLVSNYKVNFVQGFYFSKPVVINKFKELYSKEFRIKR